MSPSVRTSLTRPIVRRNAAKWIARRVCESVAAMLMLGDPITEEAFAIEAPPDEIVPLSQGFEGSIGPFDRYASGCTDCLWQAVQDAPHRGLWSAYATDSADVGETNLELTEPLAIPADATSATLSFWQRFDFEHVNEFRFDGGVLEVSIDDGENWTDAGANITVGGYNGAIDDPEERGNPLANRPAWTGTMADWFPVRVNVLPFRGQSFTFRLRMGTDNSNIALFDGWRVDDIEVRYQAPSTPCEREWFSANNYPVAVDDPAAVVHNGTLYLFGGSGEVGAIADAHAYSVQTDVWTPIEPLPAPRFGASAVSDGTAIYVLAGSADGNGTTNLWRYDPAADRYTALASLGQGTVEQAAVYLDGVIYRIAGRRDYEHTMYTTAVEAYTVATDTWAQVKAYPLDVGGLTAVAIGGYIYAAGGENPRGQVAKTYRYDPEQNVWDDGPIADLPSKAAAESAFYKDHWILLANGAVISWNPGSNRWRSLDQIPQRTTRAGVAATESTLYLVGGNQLELFASTQLYEERDCAAACVGDCGGDGEVAISDLVTGVGIALGSRPLADCPSFDSSRDASVAVNELIAAVNNALNGCG